MSFTMHFVFIGMLSAIASCISNIITVTGSVFSNGTSYSADSLW